MLVDNWYVIVMVYILCGYVLFVEQGVCVVFCVLVVFFDDYIVFSQDIFFGQLQIDYLVVFYLYYQFQLICCDMLVVGCIVKVGESVVLIVLCGYGFGEFIWSEVFCLFEYQMFQKMCDFRSVCGFICRVCFVLDYMYDNRGLVIFDYYDLYVIV